METQDWIGLARRARESAERSLREEALWLGLAADSHFDPLEPDPKGVEQYQDIVIQAVFAKRWSNTKSH